MQHMLLLLFAATAASLARPPSGTLAARDWPANCTPGHNFTVYDFSVSIPNADAANGTSISFGFSSKQTKIETKCHRNAKTRPIHLVRGVAERYACDNTSVEFVYTDGNDNKRRLALMEAACTEQTSSKSQYPIETEGSVDLELQCNEDKENGVRKCKGKKDRVRGVYVSYANRPRMEPDTPIPWSSDGGGDEGGGGSKD